MRFGLDLLHVWVLCTRTSKPLRAHLKAMGMKMDLSDIDGDLPSAEVLMDLMGQDKKVLEGKLRFILEGYRRQFVTSEVDKLDVISVLKNALSTRS